MSIEKIETRQLVIIGGGVAGLSAALEARKGGVNDILIIERDHELGGILQQCIHTGFGLQLFKEELTGPEYAQRFIDDVFAQNIEYRTNSMVVDASKDKLLTVATKGHVYKLQAQAIILCMGCREKTRGAINVPGSRPAGIFTAGTAQRFVNIEGYLPGKNIVILGSGDIGLIMARRLTLEGANVKMVCEIMPKSGGLRRNIVQCLDDFNIPLLLSHTVTKIYGDKRVTGVDVCAVDEARNPIAESCKFVECDCLILSVGLVPENELSRKMGIVIDTATNGPVVDKKMETSLDGVFAGGNVVRVYDLVDNVSKDSFIAGRSAAEYLMK